MDAGEAPLKELAEAGVEFHEKKPPWRDTALQERLRDRAAGDRGTIRLHGQAHPCRGDEWFVTQERARGEWQDQ